MAKLMKRIKGSVVWLLVLLLALLIPKPKGKKKIVSWQEVEELLKNAFGKDCHLFLVDGKYRVPTLESVEKFLREDKTDLYKYVNEWFDCPIPEETAYALGLFFAEGSCGFRTNVKSINNGAWWEVVNTDKYLLEQVYAAFRKEFKVPLKITAPLSKRVGSFTNYGYRKKQLYRLRTDFGRRATQVRYNFINEFRKMFYTQGFKKVPAGIIEGDLKAKRAFLRGVIAGDGWTTNQNHSSIALGIRGKPGLAGILDLAKDINWRSRVHRQKNIQQFYRISFNRRRENDPLILEYLKNNGETSTEKLHKTLNCTYGKLKRILDRLERQGYIVSHRPSYTRRYVKLIKEWRMGCDDFAFRLMGCFSVPGWSGITFGIATSKVHAYNCLIAEDFGVLKVYLVEPQSDEILFAREVKDENYRTVFVMM